MKLGNVSLKDYDIIFFGSATHSSPQSIIRLDNNGEILLDCRTGKTIEELKADSTKITQSQIRLLQEWRLLQREGRVFKTTVPILDLLETENLRKITKEAAGKIGPKLAEKVQALKEELISKGNEKNVYSILFSYVLDHLVWDEIEEAKRIIEREITIEKPFWAGLLWAVYPPRKFSCGTNSSTKQGVGLYLNWSRAGAKLIFSVYSDFDAYTALFEDIKKYGKVRNKKVITVFKAYNIFDSDGNLKIPVVVEDTSNNLYKLCKAFAQKVVEQVVNTLDIQELESELSIKDRGETIIITYHELMWDLLDYFESQGIIQKPVIFANPEKSGLKDVADLMFIVKQTGAK